METATTTPGEGVEISLATRLLGGTALGTLGTITAIISYSHGLDVVHAAGTTGKVAYLIPIVPDLSVASSSLALLDAARRGERGGFFPWAGLVFGASTTMIMNFAAGWQHGWSGSLVSLLAPVALVFSYESLMGMFRSSRQRAATVPAADQCPHGVATTVDHAIELAFLHGRDCLGEAPSIRNLSERFAINRPRVTTLVKQLAGEIETGLKPVADEAA